MGVTPGSGSAQDTDAPQPCGPRSPRASWGPGPGGGRRRTVPSAGLLPLGALSLPSCPSSAHGFASLCLRPSLPASVCGSQSLSLCLAASLCVRLSLPASLPLSFSFCLPPRLPVSSSASLAPCPGGSLPFPSGESPLSCENTLPTDVLRPASAPGARGGPRPAPLRAGGGGGASAATPCPPPPDVPSSRPLRRRPGRLRAPSPAPARPPPARRPHGALGPLCAGPLGPSVSIPPALPPLRGVNPGVRGTQLLSSSPQAGGGGGEEGTPAPLPPPPGRPVPRDPEKMSSRTALAPGNDRNSDTVSRAGPWGSAAGLAAAPRPLSPSPREPHPLSEPCPLAAPCPRRTSRTWDPPPLLSPSRPLERPSPGTPGPSADRFRRVSPAGTPCPAAGAPPFPARAAPLPLRAAVLRPPTPLPDLQAPDPGPSPARSCRRKAGPGPASGSGLSGRICVPDSPGAPLLSFPALRLSWLLRAPLTGSRFPPFLGPGPFPACSRSLHSQASAHLPGSPAPGFPVPQGPPRAPRPSGLFLSQEALASNFQAPSPGFIGPGPVRLQASPSPCQLLRFRKAPNPWVPPYSRPFRQDTISSLDL